MRVNRLISAAAVVALMVATTATAKPITITTQMNRFSGPRAYVVVYVTDSQGVVVDTVSVGGRSAKYYRHLRNWSRSARRSRTPISAVTGASVGSGQTLKATVDIADPLLKAGYQIRVDASIEDHGDYANAAVLKLGSESEVTGKGIVRSVQVQ